MNKDDKKKENKLGLKLYVVLLLFIYVFLQIGFSGLYTYTTWGVLYTCLMYFSIFTVYTCLFVFFKFRKKNVADDCKNNYLKRMFKAVVIIIIIFTVFDIGTYLNNMYGIKKVQSNYKTYNEDKVYESSVTNIVENTVTEESEDDVLEILDDMLAYNEAMNKFDSAYEVMEEKLPIRIGFRVLTDVIDVLISAGIIFIISNQIIIKVRKKEENIEEKTEIEDNSNSEE